MKIDSAVKLFVERYDQEALSSIEDISRDFGLRVTGATIKTFNITESFNTFSQYLRGYADYKVKNKENPNASPQSIIRESVTRFIDTQLFQETASKYADLPEFVTGYVNGVQQLTEAVNAVKEELKGAEVEVEAVGDVNKFADYFMGKLDAAFTEAMDRILWASGYNSRKAIFGKRPKKEAAPVFL